MTLPNYVVMIIPYTYRDAINACGAALNYGLSNFSIELVTPPDYDTVTHYACDAGASDVFIAIITAAHAGNLPPGIDWSVYGITAEQAIEAFAAAIFDVSQYPVDAERQKFEETLVKLGFSRKEIVD